MNKPELKMTSGNEQINFGSKLQIRGPLRGDTDIVYYSERAKIVLFGGGDDKSLNNDTWERDGNEWEQAPDTGPSNRTFHSMVYDF